MTRTCQVGEHSESIMKEGLMLQGTITAKEMLEVIGTVITMEGLNKVKTCLVCVKLLELLHPYITFILF